MPERVGVEIGMQTQAISIFSCNKTTIIAKIAQLKVCILNSINSLNVIYHSDYPRRLLNY